MNIVIQELKTFTKEEADSIRKLAKMIGHNYKELTDADLWEIVDSQNTYLFIAREIESNSIVGMALLLVYRIPYVRKAYLDDLVVDEEHRGRGIGSQLLQKVVDTAREKKAAYLDFSSRPRREEGNNLYEKFGFVKRDANVYRQVIDYGEV
ncbi:MAG: GNAT family N-acetyltransferase [Candidatus Levybacteria bacterium]|nr:GNAT family N-acetyltransferase [Candidatus Levybacteria bacterium]